MAAPPPILRSTRRLYTLLAAATICALAFGASLAVTAADMTAEPAAYHERRLIPQTDLNPYGANAFLAQEVEEWKLDKTLRMAQEAGLGWIKQQFAWEEIEPEKGRFLVPHSLTSSWAKYDKIVDAAAKHGLEIIARLDRPPAWARPAGTSGRGPIESYADYGDFVYAFVQRYKGRVRYIQVWNEPNLYYEWGGVEPNARDYVMLLRLAYRRAKEADPNVHILSAPLAPTLERSVQALSDLDYLQQMYDYGAKVYFDILAANAFGQNRPPEDPPDANVLNFQRVVLLRRIMERNGDALKAVWINEFGWNAAPADFSPQDLIWQRVTEQEQSDYTIRGLRLARTQWDWIGVICLWYLRQVGHIRPENAEYYFRMIDVDFTARPVYRAVKAEATLQPHAPGYFEESAPGVRSLAGWQHEIVPQASGGQQLATSANGAELTINFYGSSLDLVVTRDQDGGVVSVTIDGHPANRLPKDAAGRAVLDTASPELRWQAQAAVAVELAPGQHEARIIFSGAPGKRVAIDAFIVGGATTPRLPVVAFGVFAGLALGANVALIWREAKQRRYIGAKRSSGDS